MRRLARARARSVGFRVLRLRRALGEAQRLEDEERIIARRGAEEVRGPADLSLEEAVRGKAAPVGFAEELGLARLVLVGTRGRAGLVKVQELALNSRDRLACALALVKIPEG